MQRHTSHARSTLLQVSLTALQEEVEKTKTEITHNNHLIAALQMRLSALEAKAASLTDTVTNTSSSTPQNSLSADPTPMVPTSKLTRFFTALTESRRNFIDRAEALNTRVEQNTTTWQASDPATANAAISTILVNYTRLIREIIDAAENAEKNTAHTKHQGAVNKNHPDYRFAYEIIRTHYGVLSRHAFAFSAEEIFKHQLPIYDLTMYCLAEVNTRGKHNIIQHFYEYPLTLTAPTTDPTLLDLYNNITKNYQEEISIATNLQQLTQTLTTDQLTHLAQVAFNGLPSAARRQLKQTDIPFDDHLPAIPHQTSTEIQKLYLKTYYQHMLTCTKEIGRLTLQLTLTSHFDRLNYFFTLLDNSTVKNRIETLIINSLHTPRQSELVEKIFQFPALKVLYVDYELRRAHIDQLITELKVHPHATTFTLISKKTVSEPLLNRLRTADICVIDLSKKRKATTEIESSASTSDSPVESKEETQTITSSTAALLSQLTQHAASPSMPAPSQRRIPRIKQRDESGDHKAMPFSLSVPPKQAAGNEIAAPCILLDPRR